jgi:hypothetical protein
MQFAADGHNSAKSAAKVQKKSELCKFFPKFEFFCTFVRFFCVRACVCQKNVVPLQGIYGNTVKNTANKI